MTKYLIVGGSVGAIGAVEAIREIDEQGEITIVSQEACPAYSRPMISEYLAGKASFTDMLYRPANFYRDNAIDLLLGRRITALDVTEHWAELDGGERLGWRQCLLATGAVPVRPPIDGANRRGVFCFTTFADAQAIDQAICEGARTATVIGGGLIGVSVAEALSRRDVKTTLVELQDRLLSLSLDHHGSELVTRAMRQAGVEIITGIGVNAITGSPQANDVVGGVVLGDGRHITSDLVVLAIGVKPSAELAHQAGLELGRGIIVDSHMATSARDVYACGDVAEALAMSGGRRVMPLWPLAYLGGRTAGQNMAGGEAHYPGGFNLSTLKYFGVTLVAAGAVGGEAAPDAEALVFQSNGTYRKVNVREGRVVGMLFAGDIERSGLVFNLMRDGVDVSAFKESLVADDLGLAILPADLRKQALAASRLGGTGR